MSEPFERTVGIANNILKPLAQLVRENPVPPFEGYEHLYAAAIDRDVAHYLDVAAAMDDESRKVAMFEFGLVPQLFNAFGCAPLCLEFLPSFYTRVDENAVYEFLEAAEEAGVPSDTCSTDRFIIGASVKGELPRNSFFVTSSSPCDGTRIASPPPATAPGSPTRFSRRRSSVPCCSSMLPFATIGKRSGITPVS